MSESPIIKLKTKVKSNEYLNKSDFIIKEISTLNELISYINLNNQKKSVSLRFSLDNKEIIIEEDDNERLYKNKLHPFFNDMLQHSQHTFKTSEDKEISYVDDNTKPDITKYKVIDFNNTSNKDKDFTILFSPHQDDEILGSSTVISSLTKNNKEFNIVYMTSGSGGGDSDIRKEEARNALSLLGCNNTHSIFMSFPFYSNPNREVTKSDYDLMDSILLNQNPSRVFICSDVFDPHESHKKCFDIILHSLKQHSLFSKIDVFFYYSTWYWPKLNEINYYLPYDVYFLKTKIKCMLEHTSQIRNSSMGDDERPFYERVSKRDFFFGRIFGYEYCEVFYKVDSF